MKGVSADARGASKARAPIPSPAEIARFAYSVLMMLLSFRRWSPVYIHHYCPEGKARSVEEGVAVVGVEEVEEVEEVVAAEEEAEVLP